MSMMRQKGIDLNNDFYVVVGKQYRTENEYTGHTNTIYLYDLTSALYYSFVLRCL